MATGKNLCPCSAPASAAPCTHAHGSPDKSTHESARMPTAPGLPAATTAFSSLSALASATTALLQTIAAVRYTYRAARTAAGTAAELARQLVTGQASNGMVQFRPAGHCLYCRLPFPHRCKPSLLSCC
jgi:hypothetical protein